MHPVKIPIIPVPDSTTIGDIPELCFSTFEHLAGTEAECAPMLAFEIADTPRWPQTRLAGSPVPERMLIVTFDPRARADMMRDLEEVQKREAGKLSLKRLALDFKPKTALRRFYRQMAAVPMTVFSITLDPGQTFSLFFIRTPFTVSELQKEMARMAAEMQGLPDPGEGPPDRRPET